MLLQLRFQELLHLTREESLELVELQLLEEGGFILEEGTT